MCFSAQASFIVSGVLITTGVVSLLNAHKKTLKALAVTPIIFGIQQATEGIIWLAYAMPEYQSLITFATYLFLCIAMVVWPLWLPLIFMLTEKENDSARALGRWISLGSGILFSSYAIWHLMLYGASAHITRDHIAYGTEHLQLPFPWAYVLYGMATMLPLLLTRIKMAWIFAVGVGIGYLASAEWFPLHFASVWCFFAAVTSISTVFVVFYNKRSTDH